MVDRERSTPDRAAPEAQPPERERSGRRDLPETIVGLQRTAGNRAVQRVISKSGGLPEPSVWDHISADQTLLPSLVELARLDDALRAVAISLNLYGHWGDKSDSDPEMNRKLNEPRRELVKGIKQSGAANRVVALALELRDKRDAVRADVDARGYRNAASQYLAMVRPSYRDFMTWKELELWLEK